MLSMRSLYSGGTFYFSERKQDYFFLVKIFIYLLLALLRVSLLITLGGP